MIFLTEDDVRRVLTMDMALEAVEGVLRDLALGKAHNLARGRASTERVMLHLLGGADATSGVVGYKAYSTSRQGAHFQVGLFDGVDGQALALLQADFLGQVRTGAASGVATKCLARPDAATVGLFGTGKQARTQAWAMSRVRQLRSIRVFSTKEENRLAFVREMTPVCQCPIEPVARPEDAVRGMDIVITATTSRTPVFDGAWLAPGTHLNVVGSNYLNKTEIDVETLRRCQTIVVDDIAQARIEAGDFVAALHEGVLTWDAVHSLGDVLVGRHPGRQSAEEITLFKSLGLGVEDIATAARVVTVAKEQGVGMKLES